MQLTFLINQRHSAKSIKTKPLTNRLGEVICVKKTCQRRWTKQSFLLVWNSKPCFRNVARILGWNKETPSCLQPPHLHPSEDTVFPWTPRVLCTWRSLCTFSHGSLYTRRHSSPASFLTVLLGKRKKFLFTFIFLEIIGIYSHTLKGQTTKEMKKQR